MSLKDGGVFVSAWADVVTVAGGFPDGSALVCLVGGVTPNAVRGARGGTAGAASCLEAFRLVDAAIFNFGFTGNPRGCRPTGMSPTTGDVFTARWIEDGAKVLAGASAPPPCREAFRARNAAIFRFGFTEKPCRGMPGDAVDPRTNDAEVETAGIAGGFGEPGLADSEAASGEVFVRIEPRTENGRCGLNVTERCTLKLASGPDGRAGTRGDVPASFVATFSFVSARISGLDASLIRLTIGPAFLVRVIADS